MDYFVVRIYRHERDNPMKLVGTVEDATAEPDSGKKAFTNLNEL